MSPIVTIILYFVCFAISFYALSAINFGKLIYPGRTMQTQVLLILLSMALAYLAVQFLLGLSLAF